MKKGFFIFWLCPYLLWAQQSGSSTEVASITFEVCAVEPLPYTAPAWSMQELLEVFLLRKNEAAAKKAAQGDSLGTAAMERLLFSHTALSDSLILTQSHPFLQAVHLSYARHLPLELTPDMIWLLILQGFALHVQQNADSLASSLVFNKEKETITVFRPDYQPQSGDYWEGIAADFSDMLATKTKDDLKEVLLPDFSTSTATEKLACQVSMMEALSPYFSYRLYILCGIPRITLKGSPQDWETLIAHTQALKKYDLHWWIDELMPILHEFKAASEGKAKKGFWKNIFLEETVRDGCATEYFYWGWVFKFFPYLKQGYNEEGKAVFARNPFMKKAIAPNDKDLPRFEFEDIPNGLSVANLTLEGMAGNADLNIYAGFMGIKKQAKNNAVSPVITWFVSQK